MSQSQPPHKYQTAAYLLGLGPMPPPCPQDIAVAMMNHCLDNLPADEIGNVVVAGNIREENIDPQLYNGQDIDGGHLDLCSIIVLIGFSFTGYHLYSSCL